MRTIVLLCLAFGTTACATKAAATPQRPPPPAPPVRESAGPGSVIGAEIVARTNAERAKLGLSALNRNANLMRAAQIQASQMAALRKMAHDLPDAEYPSLSTRLGAVGYQRVASGENVAEGYSTATAVVAGWMTSQGHRDNIVSPRFTEVGAAVATGSNGRPYYVQVFARPR